MTSQSGEPTKQSVSAPVAPSVAGFNAAAPSPVSAATEPHLVSRRGVKLLWGAALLAALLSLVPVGYFVKSALLEVMVEKGIAALRSFDAGLPRLTPQADESEEFSPLFAEPSSAVDVEQVEQTEVRVQTAQKTSKSAPQKLVPQKTLPSSARASQQAVLFWAEHRMVPLSRSRPAESGLPPGT